MRSIAHSLPAVQPVRDSADVLRRLARVLHCAIDWLVGLYDDDPAADSWRPGAAVGGGATHRVWLEGVVEKP